MLAYIHPYPKYKPSGIARLDDLPVDWETTRLKAIGRIRYGLGQPPRESPTGLPLIRATNVSRGRIVEIDLLRIDPDDVPVGRDAFLREKEIIVVRSGAYTADSAIVPSTYTGSVAGYDMVLTVTGAYPEFIAAALLSDYLRDDQLVVASTRAAQPHLNAAELGTSVVVLPPSEEQAAIVRFLNHADEQIQRYITAKERLIALLEEERQALVDQAVTRGLDPNVRLKDSSVDWIGDMPEHWERCRLRNIVSEVTTGSRGWSSYASDSGPLFIRVANLSRGSLQLRFDDVVRLNLPKTSEVSRTRIRAGDLLVSVTAFIGSVGVAPEDLGEAYVSQHVARCRPHTGLSSQWLGYMLLSNVGQTHGQLSLYGGTKDGLSLDDVKNYQILLPPRSEQTAIAEYLNNSSIDSATNIDRARRQIELMEEYHARLISDVVTGQLDVREAAEQLTDTENGNRQPRHQSPPFATQ